MPSRLDGIYHDDRVVDLVDRFAYVLHDATLVPIALGVGNDLLAEILLLAAGIVPIVTFWGVHRM